MILNKICQMCIYALINQLICITNNRCLIGITKLVARTYISPSTKIRAPSAARILVLRDKYRVYEIVIKEAIFFNVRRICNEKCSKPKIFLASLSKLLCFSFIL
jgi:hypothetical protein